MYLSKAVFAFNILTSLWAFVSYRWSCVGVDTQVLRPWCCVTEPQGLGRKCGTDTQQLSENLMCVTTICSTPLLSKTTENMISSRSLMVGWSTWWIEWVSAFIYSPRVVVLSLLPHMSPYLFPPLFFFFKFGELGGFTAIQTKLNTDEIEIAVSGTAPASMFLPFFKIVLTYF